MAKQEEPRRPRVHRGPAVRLRVVVAGGRWRVEKATEIERMSLLASWEPDERQAATAACFELVDRNGEVVYRRPMPAVDDTSVELFESAVPHREDAERPVIFSVLVPRIPDATTVRLIDRGRELERDDDKRPAYEIGEG